MIEAGEPSARLLFTMESESVSGALLGHPGGRRNAQVKSPVVNQSRMDHGT